MSNVKLARKTQSLYQLLRQFIVEILHGVVVEAL